MKNVMIIAALTFAGAAGTASAYAPNELPATYVHQVRAFVPKADLSNLTAVQVQRIESIFTGSGNDSAGEDVAGQIRAILSPN